LTLQIIFFTDIASINLVLALRGQILKNCVDTMCPSALNLAQRRDAKKAKKTSWQRKLKPLCQDVLKCMMGDTLEKCCWHPARVRLLAPLSSSHVDPLWGPMGVGISLSS